MKKIIFILLGFSQAVLAQHKKKEIPPKVPLERQVRSLFAEGELLNNTLKGSKWYFDLRNYDQTQLLLDKDKVKPDVLYFVDAKKFQININQKNCKSLIKGTYEIMKEADENTTVMKGHRSFIITSPYQKCVSEFSGFLLEELDISFNEAEQSMEMKISEDSVPITVPGF
jgi:hypothetical protein